MVLLGLHRAGLGASFWSERGCRARAAVRTRLGGEPLAEGGLRLGRYMVVSVLLIPTGHPMAAAGWDQGVDSLWGWEARLCPEGAEAAAWWRGAPCDWPERRTAVRAADSYRRSCLGPGL